MPDTDYSNVTAYRTIELDVIDPSITCDDCGQCCKHMGYPPFLTIPGSNDEWDELPEDQQDAILDAMDERRGDKELPCIWFDESTAKCRHYDLRPSICRDFPVGGDSCQKYRSERNKVS